MIDVCQWRATIGHWSCHNVHSSSSYSNQCCSSTFQWSWRIVPNLTFTFTLPVSILFLLRLLSGDIELNPGPTLDDKPTMELLIEWLDPLIEWESFGYLLPGILPHDIQRIQRDNAGNVDNQKVGLFLRWLSIHPNGTWRDIISALERRNENSLAQAIRRHLQTSCVKSKSK